MMMMGIKFMGKVPFKEVYIHALVLDLEGKKMSKSKGNVIDPLTVMDEYGTDAFRFTLAALSVQGRDMRLAEERIKGYRNFANKIWNAARFVLMHVATYDPDLVSPEKSPDELADRWIVSRLQRITKLVEETLKEYRFNELAHELYQFVWHEVCDWYLELIKPVMTQDDGSDAKAMTQRTMLEVLATSLQLLHPVMPFITEEIWQKLPGTRESIMISPFPQCNPEKIDVDAEEKMTVIVDVVNSIRAIRWEMNIAPSQKVDVILVSLNAERREVLSEHMSYIQNLAKASLVTVSDQVQKPESAATGVAHEVEIFIPLKGIIDFTEEERRLNKEINKIKKERATVTKKLSNESFLSKAPPDIITKEKNKEQDLGEKQEKLETSLNRIRKLIAE
jgi:valyl-tRNA synthetase